MPTNEIAGSKTVPGQAGASETATVAVAGAGGPAGTRGGTSVSLQIGRAHV